jgi:hypothetical protein
VLDMGWSEDGLCWTSPGHGLGCDWAEHGLGIAWPRHCMCWSGHGLHLA